MQTLTDLFENAAKNFGERPAMTMRHGLRDKVWTYEQLWQAINQLACQLEERGIRQGDRVLLLAPNSPEMVAGLIGTMLRGAIAVPLDMNSTPEFVMRVAEDTQAVALLGMGNTELPGLKQYAIGALLEGTIHYAGARAKPGDIAEIIYTSGTTGKPKGVVLSHANIVASTFSATSMVPPDGDWRLLSLLPLSHMFEQTVGLFGPMMSGACVHYGISRQSAAIGKAMRRYRINVMVVVPQLLSHMFNGIERNIERSNHQASWQRANQVAQYMPMALRRFLFRNVHHRLGSELEYFLCGGARLAPETGEAWERIGVKVIQGYGATECAPLIACNTPQSRIPGSVGHPAKDVQVRIAQDGEIQVQGDNVFSGYWCKAEASQSAFTPDGWYGTGDLGEFDSSGNLIIKGRKKDMVVLPSGMNVYLEDIERVLNVQPGVRASVVLDTPKANGETGFTAVLLSEAGCNIEQAIRQANARLASHQKLDAFRQWDKDDFPRTAIGKLKRHEVRVWLNGQGAETAKKEPPPEQNAVSPLQRVLSGLSGVKAEQITPQNDLTLDLGLSSLARVELALLLEENFNVAIEDADLAQVEKVAQLQSLIERGGSAAQAVEMASWPLSSPASMARKILQAIILFPVHRAVARPFKVDGLENLQGLALPALFISNHASHVDTVSIIHALPTAIRHRLAVAAAQDYFYRFPLIGAVTSLLINTFPFSREGAIRTSLEYCGELADKNWSILIYPEGTRTTTGELLPFKLGIGLLATQMQVPVVPVTVSGGLEVLPKGRAIPRPAPVTVRFGKPIKFSENDKAVTVSRRLHEVVSELMATEKPSTP